MLTAREKRLIKKLSHDLKPLIRIGKNGVTPATIANIDKALNDHELIKIKYLEHKDQKKTLTRRITEETRSELINQIGNTATLYRESPDPQKREINLTKKPTKTRR
jgi:RNA-binding protein